jgi:cytochrome c553
MNLDRLSLVGAVAAACLLAVGAPSGLLAGIAGALVGGAAGIEVPPLDDPVLIRRGAAHYDLVCARCHGSPLRRDQSAAVDLSPSPPVLHRRIAGFPPEQLFHVIKDGVPGTGMPAWPAEDRDDEVWAMVAFVAQLPALDAAAYSALAGSARSLGDEPFATCARCHGSDGRGSSDGAFPRLDIQSPQYLLATLAAFRDGRRSSGIMQSVTTGMKDEELAAAAEHFGRATVPDTADGPERPAAPSCTACHGVGTPARPAFPSLAGQHPRYLDEQFEKLSDPDHPRGGGPFVGLMHAAARLAERPDR